MLGLVNIGVGGWDGGKKTEAVGFKLARGIIAVFVALIIDWSSCISDGRTLAGAASASWGGRACSGCADWAW